MGTRGSENSSSHCEQIAAAPPPPAPEILQSLHQIPKMDGDLKQLRYPAYECSVKHHSEVNRAGVWAVQEGGGVHPGLGWEVGEAEHNQLLL